MEKKVLLVVCFCCLIALINGCSDDDSKKVAIQDFVLVDGCKWSEFERDKLYRIDSQSELLNYVECEDNEIPQIDFNKNTLLVIRFYLPNPGYTITKKLTRSLNGYLFEIKCKSSGTVQPALVTLTHVAILVDKLDASSSVELLISKQ